MQILEHMFVSAFLINTIQRRLICTTATTEKRYYIYINISHVII